MDDNYMQEEFELYGYSEEEQSEMYDAYGDD